jgi:hypothetical protein
MPRYPNVLKLLGGWKSLAELVHRFFGPRPFMLRLNPSRSLRAVVRDVIAQAQDRQRNARGDYSADRVLQHLVHAKLDCALGPGHFVRAGFPFETPRERKADFLVGDVAVHVTTSPSEVLLDRCSDNLNDGYRAIVVTLQKGLPAAQFLAENRGIADRIDIFEIEQFLALNLYRLGRFKTDGSHAAVTDLVQRYNDIIDDVETDPSLQIDLHR